MPKLTPKQEAFCQEYAKDKNAGAAALRAGYREDYGRELRTKTHVVERCDELLAEAAERNAVDVDYLIKRLKAEAEGAGPDTNAAARVSALDKLAKHLGFYDADNKQRVTNFVVDLTAEAKRTGQNEGAGTAGTDGGAVT